ncbi:hypothetical protein C8Q80DRAFT_1273834 [Daedaleopsis nitida]|nr:hypothetical protein C8Q80DRAFT_1273834 [Daedaleopsis nitida]
MADPMLTIHLTIGVILVGLMVTGALFGVTASQVVWYYRHYSRDRSFLKYMVAVVCGLDTLSLAFFVATEWQTLVIRDPATKTSLPWTSSAQIICNAVSIAIIQSFYIFRIWTLSRSKILVGCLGTFVAADLALGFTLFAQAVNSSGLIAFTTLVSYDVALSAITTATDVFLSGSLVVLLTRSRTGISGSNRLINRLLLYTINTGLLTSMCSIMTLITVVIFPTDAIYVMFYYIGSRMYTISLLSTLNAREGLRSSAEQQYTFASVPRLTTRVTASGMSTDEDGQKHTAQEILVSIQRDTTVTFEEDVHAPKMPTRRSGSGRKAVKQMPTPVPASKTAAATPWDSDTARLKNDSTATDTQLSSLV